MFLRFEEIKMCATDTRNCIIHTQQKINGYVQILKSIPVGRETVAFSENNLWS